MGKLVKDFNTSEEALKQAVVIHGLSDLKPVKSEK